MPRLAANDQFQLTFHITQIHFAKYFIQNEYGGRDAAIKLI